MNQKIFETNNKKCVFCGEGVFYEKKNQKQKIYFLSYKTLFIMKIVINNVKFQKKNDIK